VNAERGANPQARTVWAWLLAATVGLALLPTPAAAYPWMIRHDYTGCGVCHVDPSGAGMLTDYGRAQSVLLMQMHYGEPPKGDEAPGYADFMFGLFPMPEWLLAQVTFRGAEFWVTSTSPGATPGSTVTSSDQRILWMLLDARAELKLGIFRASGSLGWGNTPFTLPAAVVTNPDGTNELLARDYWIGLQPDDTLLIRLGRINIPFGLRNVEHTAWVRNNTQTDINYSQQSGLSVAFDNSKVRTEVLLMLGNLNVQPDSYRQRGITGLVEVPVAERTTVGLSAFISRAGQSTSSNSPLLRQVYGAFTRWSPVEPIVVMAEADVFLQDNLGSGNTQPNGVSWVQVNWQIIQGLYLSPAIETLTSYGVSGTGIGTWLTIDWFCLPHTELRLDGLYRYEPTNAGASNVFSFLIQLHVYL
jgi:hypothetical protein